MQFWLSVSEIARLPTKTAAVVFDTTALKSDLNSRPVGFEMQPSSIRSKSQGQGASIRRRHSDRARLCTHSDSVQAQRSCMVDFPSGLQLGAARLPRQQPSIYVHTHVGYATSLLYSVQRSSSCFAKRRDASRTLLIDKAL